MHLISSRLRPKLWLVQASGLILLFGVFATTFASWMEQKRLTVFSASSTFSVDVTEADNQEYVSLNNLLAPLGQLEVSTGKNKIRLHFNSVEAQFENRESTANIGGHSIALGGRAIVEENRVMVPLSAIAHVLPRILSMRADYHQGSHRLFLGDAGTHFALELRKGEGTHLVLSFSVPVSPQISTESGKLKMVFANDPVAMASQSWQFDDSVITAAHYTDAAQPELVISGNQPLLATFADAGKSISVMPAPAVSSDSPSAAPAGQQIATGQPAGAPLPQPSANPASALASTESPVTIAPAAPQVRYLIAIDASHGGNEPGAALGQQLLEKDVTLAIARKLRSQLQVRGLDSVMVRDGDTTVSLDDRAALANTSHAAVYVALHAGNLGRGVRVYTSTLSSTDASPGLFVPWDKVQANFVRSSQVVASVSVDEFTKNETQVPVALFPAPVRPLNNVAGAALAVEVAPLRGNVESLTNPSYQDAVAEALAAALTSVRPKIEARQ